VNWPDYINQLQKYGADKQLNDSIDSLTNAISARILSAATIWCFGNGGSSTTAEHFAADLLLMGTRTGAESRALSLTSQVGSITPPTQRKTMRGTTKGPIGSRADVFACTQLSLLGKPSLLIDRKHGVKNPRTPRTSLRPEQSRAPC
jgi:hypothetical protein